MVSGYVFINGVGFIIATFLAEHRLRGLSTPDRGYAYVIAVCAVPVGWLAAHAGDMLVRGLAFDDAGFVFLWGLIGAVAFAVVLSRFLLSPEAARLAANALVPVLVLAHAIGRIGCFWSGCCYGCIVAHHWRHPVQLYEALFLLGLFVVLLRIPAVDGWRVTTTYLLAYPVFRFLLEFLRADDRGACFGLSTSQLLALPLFGLGAALFIYSRPSTQSA